ncbi:MAG: ATP-dependent Clp protease adapter ClpS [Acidobacteriota bacterium]
MSDSEIKRDENTVIKEREKTITPMMYRVILINDDYTTMDFVVDVLIKFFNKTASEATKIMLEVHKKGKAACGVYTYDIAVTKVNQVIKYSRDNEFPLKCNYEKA